MTTYKVIMKSSGGVVYDRVNGMTFEEATEFCEQHNWMWIDRNEFEWDLEITEESYMDIAIRYCERYGICEMHVVGNTMIYYTSFPMEHTTYKAVVDLDTLEENRTAMSKYYKPYKSLIGGKYQANDRA